MHDFKKKSCAIIIAIGIAPQIAAEIVGSKLTYLEYNSFEHYGPTTYGAVAQNYMGDGTSWFIWDIEVWVTGINFNAAGQGVVMQDTTPRVFGGIQWFPNGGGTCSLSIEGTNDPTGI